MAVERDVGSDNENDGVDEDDGTARRTAEKLIRRIMLRGRRE